MYFQAKMISAVSIQGLVHCKLTHYISPIYETPGFGLTFPNSHGPFSRLTGVKNSTQLTSTAVKYFHLT